MSQSPDQAPPGTVPPSKPHVPQSLTDTILKESNLHSHPVPTPQSGANLRSGSTLGASHVLTLPLETRPGPLRPLNSCLKRTLCSNELSIPNKIARLSRPEVARAGQGQADVDQNTPWRASMEEQNCDPLTLSHVGARREQAGVDGDGLCAVTRKVGRPSKQQALPDSSELQLGTAKSCGYYGLESVYGVAARQEEECEGGSGGRAGANDTGNVASAQQEYKHVGRAVAADGGSDGHMDDQVGTSVGQFTGDRVHALAGCACGKSGHAASRLGSRAGKHVGSAGGMPTKAVLGSVHAKEDGQLDGGIDGQVDGGVDRQKEGRLDGQMDGQVTDQMDGQVDGHTVGQVAGLMDSSVGVVRPAGMHRRDFTSAGESHPVARDVGTLAHSSQCALAIVAQETDFVHRTLAREVTNSSKPLVAPVSSGQTAVPQATDNSRKSRQVNNREAEVQASQPGHPLHFGAQGNVPVSALQLADQREEGRSCAAAADGSQPHDVAEGTSTAIGTRASEPARKPTSPQQSTGTAGGWLVTDDQLFNILSQSPQSQPQSPHSQPHTPDSQITPEQAEDQGETQRQLGQPSVWVQGTGAQTPLATLTGQPTQGLSVAQVTQKLVDGTSAPLGYSKVNVPSKSLYPASNTPDQALQLFSRFAGMGNTATPPPVTQPPSLSLPPMASPQSVQSPVVKMPPPASVGPKMPSADVSAARGTNAELTEARRDTRAEGGQAPLTPSSVPLTVSTSTSHHDACGSVPQKATPHREQTLTTEHQLFGTPVNTSDRGPCSTPKTPAGRSGREMQDGLAATFEQHRIELTPDDVPIFDFQPASVTATSSPAPPRQQLPSTFLGPRIQLPSPLTATIPTANPALPTATAPIHVSVDPPTANLAVHTAQSSPTTPPGSANRLVPSPGHSTSSTTSLRQWLASSAVALFGPPAPSAQAPPSHHQSARRPEGRRRTRARSLPGSPTGAALTPGNFLTVSLKQPGPNTSAQLPSLPSFSAAASQLPVLVPGATLVPNQVHVHDSPRSDILPTISPISHTSQSGLVHSAPGGPAVATSQQLQILSCLASLSTQDLGKALQRRSGKRSSGGGTRVKLLPSLQARTDHGAADRPVKVAKSRAGSATESVEGAAADKGGVGNVEGQSTVGDGMHGGVPRRESSSMVMVHGTEYSVSGMREVIGLLNSLIGRGRREGSVVEVGGLGVGAGRCWDSSKSRTTNYSLVLNAQFGFRGF